MQYQQYAEAYVAATTQKQPTATSEAANGTAKMDRMNTDVSTTVTASTTTLGEKRKAEAEDESSPSNKRVRIGEIIMSFHT